MRSNERLQRILAAHRLEGGLPVAAVSAVEPVPGVVSDLRLFALTFAAGFLFTSIFIA